MCCEVHFFIKKNIKYSVLNFFDLNQSRDCNSYLLMYFKLFYNKEFSVENEWEKHLHGWCKTLSMSEHKWVRLSNLSLKMDKLSKKTAFKIGLPIWKCSCRRCMMSCQQFTFKHIKCITESLNHNKTCSANVW